PGLPRVIPKGGMMIDGEFVPEDTIIAVNPWAQMQSEENFYPDPQIFRPERWLPGGLGPDSRASKNAILSFSMGPFSCLGKPLAIQELRQVISKVLLTYDLKYAPEFDPVKFEEGIHNMRTTIFTYPLTVVATRRQH
ncbi:cytochrome P450, partial [Obba rivulosa]